MTDADKIAAFDALAVAMTNRFADGSWDWWCPSPCGGNSKRATRGEAVADLVEWATKIARRKSRASGAQTNGGGPVPG